MRKRSFLEEGCHCRGKRQQQGANAKRRIPDPGRSKIGRLTIDRVSNDPDAVSCWQLSNRDIQAAHIPQGN